MTQIINLFGAPGAGKSTTATGLFHMMKLAGYNVEYVSEVAKDFTWEKRNVSLSCQPYVFGKQFRDIYRLIDQVEFIITDSPLFLSAFYAKEYPNEHVASTTFIEYVLDQSKWMGGINIFLNRTKVYNPAGRNQSEAESDEFAKKIKYLLKLHKFQFEEMDGNEEAPKKIFDKYLEFI